jgi:hypothetical protein
MSSRILRVFVASVVVSTVSACGGDSSTGPKGISGSYSLQTMNGKVLPYTVLDTVVQGVTVRVEAVSPTTLTIGASSDFRMILTSRVSATGFAVVEADTISGTYSRSGSALTLSAPGGAPVPGTWDQGDAITLTSRTGVLIFRR